MGVEAFRLPRAHFGAYGSPKSNRLNATDSAGLQRGAAAFDFISRCSKLVYTIHAGIIQFNIALSHSFAPTARAFKVSKKICFFC